MLHILLLAGCTESDIDPDSGAPTPEDPTPGASTPEDTGEEPIPSEPPDPDVQNQIPEGYVPADPVRIIFLGDSITEGVGASSSAVKYTALLQENTDAWPGWDDFDLQTSFPNLVEVIDLSQGGATTVDVLNEQLPDLEQALGYPASGETLVVMTIGGNDLQQALIPFQDAAAIVDRALGNFEAIADVLLDPANFPDGTWLHATNVYDPTDAVGQSQACFFGIDFSEDLPQLDRFNGQLAALGEERGFAALDLHGHFLGHGYHGDEATVAGHDPDDVTLWFAPDCIHPVDRGHHEIRRLFHASITGAVFTYELP